MSASKDYRNHNQFMREVTVHSLRFGAGFLIWGFRVCATGHVRCARVREGFERAFSEGNRTLQLMETFTTSLAATGRRRIYCAIPACGNLTHDELCLIQAFEAAQDEHPERVAMQLTWLLGENAPPALCRCVQQLAALFQCRGYRIGLREESGLVRTGALPCVAT